MTSLINKSGGPSSFATKAAVLATNSNLQNSQNPNQIDKVVESVANANKRLSQTSTSSNKRKSENSIGPWKLGRTLGRGSTGRVRLAKHSTTGQLSAVKIVPKASANSNDEQQQAKKKNPKYDENGLPYGIEREIIIMKLISHPNIMALYDVWENTNELYLVLEYVEGGELFDYLIRNGRLTESEAVNYFKQIVRGVEYCHRFNICHRDLKPENILLDKNHNIKIADFGMAALETNSRLLETSCGSPHYASPEIVAGKNYHGSPSDVWSCGIILFALLTGHLPFDDSNIRKLLLKVQTGKFQMPNSLSAEAKDLIWSMLRVNPKERISIHSILKHPLLTKYPDSPNSIYNNYKGGFTIDDVDFDLNKPVTKIDDSILRNLQTLWHGINLNQIIAKLQNNEKNYEKIFYFLLSKYKEEHFGEDDNTMFGDENSLVSKGRAHSHSKSMSNNGSPNRVKSHTHDHSSKKGQPQGNEIQSKRSSNKAKGNSDSDTPIPETRKKSKKPTSKAPTYTPKKLTSSGSSTIIKTTIQNENGDILKSVTKEMPTIYNDFITSPNKQPLKRHSSSRLNIQASNNNNNNATGITASSSIKKSVSFKSSKGKISRSNTSVNNSLHSKSLSPSPKKISASGGRLNGSSLRMIGRSKHEASNSISINPKDLPELPDLDLSEFNYLVDTIFEGNENTDAITLNFDLDDFTVNADQNLRAEVSFSDKDVYSTSPSKFSRTLNPKASNTRLRQNKNASLVLEKFGVRMSRLDFASQLPSKPLHSNAISNDSTNHTAASTSIASSSLAKSQSSSTRNLNSFLNSDIKISEYNQKIEKRQLSINTSRSKYSSRLNVPPKLSTNNSSPPKKFSHSADKSMDYSSDYDGIYSLHSAVQIPIDSPATNLFNFDTDVKVENQVPLLKEPSGVTQTVTHQLPTATGKPTTKDNGSDKYADAEIENEIDISQVIFDDIDPSELRYHRKVESISTQESQLNKVMQQPFPTIRCSLLANSNYDMPEGNDNKRLSLTPEKRKSYSASTITPASESDGNSKLKTMVESVFSDPEDDSIPITFNSEIQRENTTIFYDGAEQKVLELVNKNSESEEKELHITPTRSSKSHQPRLSMQSAHLLNTDRGNEDENSSAPIVARHAYSTLPFRKPNKTFFQTSKLENELDGIDYEVPASSTDDSRDSRRFSAASKRGATRIISSILGNNKLDDITDQVDISPIETTFEDAESSKQQNKPVKKQLRFASSTFIKEDIGGIINMGKGKNSVNEKTVDNKRPNWFMRFFNSMSAATNNPTKAKKSSGFASKDNNSDSKEKRRRKGNNTRWKYRKTTDKIFNRNNVYYVESNYLSSGKLIDHLEKELTKLNSVRILSQGSIKGSVKTISVYINDGLKENELNFHVEIEDQEGYEFGFGGCFVRIIKVSQTGSPKFFKTCCEVIEKNIIDLEKKEKIASN